MAKKDAVKKAATALSKLSTQAQASVVRLAEVQGEAFSATENAEAEARKLAKALFPTAKVFGDYKGHYKPKMAAIREVCGNGWVYRIVRADCVTRFGGLTQADGTVSVPGESGKGMTAGRWLQGAIVKCEALALYVTDKVPSADVEESVMVLCTALAGHVNTARAALVKYQDAEKAAATPVQDIGKAPGKAKIRKAA